MTLSSPPKADNAHQRITAIVRLLTTLTKKLPETIPVATLKDKIAQVFQNIPEASDHFLGATRFILPHYFKDGPRFLCNSGY
jgi:hypothetical protein